MAFNFNWAPLTTSNTSSSAFYSHAKSLLTAALNKSQKPPIIVDDIFVEELNLGQSAPELEILEIGDLAEDRFRGIFRMSYDGDAFLTLKTKVQANPLNTYLSTTPSYTSPMPLAASSPLTIPLQITLSQFRLSGFIILVFSKAKGITLVFRNDPLESLKVSSTFDTIPFIKEYLQNEIERQVRGLFQEELPVAVHRLSLRLWNPEYAASLGLDAQDVCPTSPTDGLEDDVADDAAPAFVNPLLSPSDTPDTPSITFSQKNLAALRDLSESQRTLAVSTPSISDAVFRAWASGGGSSAPWDRSGTVEPPGTPVAGPQTYTFSDNGDAVSSGANLSLRPALNPSSSSQSLSPTAISGRSRGKKRKHRVVNLRPMKEAPVSAEPAISPTLGQESTKAKPEAESSSPRSESFVTSPTGATLGEVRVVFESPAPPSPSLVTENTIPAPALPSGSTEKARPQAGASSPISSGILEQAFMMKLAGEMQRRLEGERRKRSVSVGTGKIWREVERELRELSRDPEAPPAYRQ